MQQLDQVIQQNASASEEMASTSEELSSQAEQLQNAISYFRISTNTVPPTGGSFPNACTNTSSSPYVRSPSSHGRIPNQCASPGNAARS